MTDTPPIICAGTKTQEQCHHFRGTSCRHPLNVVTDLVLGGTTTKNSASYLRVDKDRCGPGAQWYKPADKANWP